MMSTAARIPLTASALIFFCLIHICSHAGARNVPAPAIFFQASHLPDSDSEQLLPRKIAQYQDGDVNCGIEQSDRACIAVLLA